MSRATRLTRAQRLKRRTRQQRRTSLLALIIALAVLGTAGTAIAFFAAGGGGNAAALGDSLPKGATPNTPTAVTSTVTVTFNQVNTSVASGSVPITSYALHRYPSPGAGTPVGSCGVPSGGVVTCTDTGVPDGPWTYTDTPRYGTNWVGTESDPSPSVTVSSVAPASKLAFTIQPATNADIQATGTGTFSASVAVQDSSGTTILTDSRNVTLDIGTNPSAGVLSCTNVGGLTVAASSGVASFTGCAITKAGTGYKLTATSSPSLTSPVNANSFNITAGTANKLAFTTQPVGGPSSFNATLGPITVEVEDSNGNPVTGARTVNLSSAGGGTVSFATTQNASGSTSLALAIGAGSSSGTFYYGNSSNGTKTITAASTSPTTITSATQQEVIGSNKLAIISTAISDTATNSPTLGPLTVQLQNAAGTPITTGATVNLASNSSGTKEFSLTSGGSTIASVAITAGNSSANFFYGDTKAGTPTITASASSVAPGTQVETISAAAATTIAVSSGSGQSAGISTAFANPLVALVTDAFSNPVPGVTVTFTAPGSGASGTFTGGVNTAATNASGLATSVTFTANGTPGAYSVSANATGTNTVNFSETNAATTVTSFTTTNLSGKAEAGDTLVITFSAAVKPSSICSAWTTTGAHSISNGNISVTVARPGSGNNTLSISDTTDCSGDLKIFAGNSLNLGTTGYSTGSILTPTVTFGPSFCPVFSTCSSVVINAADTQLTITLGSQSNLGTAGTVASNPGVTYTPNASILDANSLPIGGSATDSAAKFF